jgi:hypothetical protein
VNVQTSVVVDSGQVPPHVADVEGDVGVAVKVSTVPAGKVLIQALVQEIFAGAMLTVPGDPVAKVTLNAGPEPVPPPVKQITFAVI